MSLPSPFSSAFPLHFASVSLSEISANDNLPEEQEFANSFRGKHAQEFLLGRIAARKALAQLVPKTPQQFIGPDERGIPRWPSGIVGSISHSHGVAVAAVATSSKYLAIGIDIESKVQRSLKFVTRVASDSEQKWIFEKPAQELTRALTIFSAKESIYKALFPICRTFFGFDAVELKPLTDKMLQATLVHCLCDSLPVGFTFQVHFLSDDAYILTGVAL